MYKRCVCAAQFTLHIQKVFLLIIQHLHLISASSNVVDLLNMQHFSGTLYLLWAFFPPAVWNVFDGALVLFFFWLVFPKTKRPPNKHLPEKKNLPVVFSLYAALLSVCCCCMCVMSWASASPSIVSQRQHPFRPSCTHTHTYLCIIISSGFFFCEASSSARVFLYAGQSTCWLHRVPQQQQMAKKQQNMCKHSYYMQI